MQLIEPGLDLYDTMNNRRLGPEYVQEKFGVPPGKLGEVLALMGDSVDNVPGVPGIGPKRASDLINQFGDVEAVLAAAPGLKPSKMRDNLIEHAEMARLSRSEEHTSELQSLMRTSYAVFCLKKNRKH